MHGIVAALVVTELTLKCLFTNVKKKKTSICVKFTYEVTSDPDCLLCLAVVYVCYEKALKMPSGSVQKIITDAVQSDVWLPQKYFFISECALVYDVIIAL